ncbi:MAG: type IV pilus twitching motility protein PilT [Nitrospirota bacterium]
MHINEYLKKMVGSKASDMYLKVGSPPVLRVDGRLTYMTQDDNIEVIPRLSPAETSELAYSVMDESQKRKFEEQHGIDLAYSAPGLGRFRSNVFRQRNTIALVFRMIPFEIPSFDELYLPEVIRDLASIPRGLIVVTGATGSGKSTTLAAMIDHINSTRRSHIITVEDPIEFLHRDRESVIEQREVEMDTRSFAEALKHVVRQNPDVIMIGEMRDIESLSACLSAAETGHLVMTTMHTIDAPQTIERIINFFPPYQHNQIRMQLSMVLKGVISQRLLPRSDGTGRVPAAEILTVTPLVRKLIEEAKTLQISSAITGGKFYGMQSFNQSLVHLYQNGLVTFEDALDASSNPEEFRLNIRGIYAGGSEIFEFKQEE